MNIGKRIRKWYYEKILRIDYKKYAIRWIDELLELKLEDCLLHESLFCDYCYVDLSKEIYDIYGVLYTPKLFNKMFNRQIERRNFISSELVDVHFSKYSGEKVKIPYKRIPNGQRFVEAEEVLLFSKDTSYDYRSLVQWAHKYFEQNIRNEISCSQTCKIPISAIEDAFEHWRRFVLRNQNGNRLFASAFKEVAEGEDVELIVNANELIFKAKENKAS